MLDETFRRLVTAAHLTTLLVFTLVSLPAGAMYRPSLSDRQLCESLLDEHDQGLLRDFEPRRPTVVLVDGYSSGRFFPRALIDAGLQVVHVHAHHQPPPNLADSFWPNTYHRILTHDEDHFGALIEELRRMNTVAVIPGTDTGVLFADRIAAVLHAHDPRIPSNGIERARKDKAEMQWRIAQAGLDSIQQTVTADVEESLRWIRARGLLTKPGAKVVVKPLMSAGGEGVFFPTTEEGVRQAFRKLLGQDDGLGYRNTRVLTQEFLEGEEYVVNSTVWKGKVVCTDIWKYNKRPISAEQKGYGSDELLESDGPLQRELRAYDARVLKALGIEFGNSHTEIMMVEGRGPVLIENNNRPMGSSLPAFAKVATGRSQIDLTALAISDPEAFAKLAEGYAIRKNAIVFTIANLYGREMKLDPGLRRTLKRLPGYFRDSLHFGPGEISPPTADMFTNVGEVWLLHEDMDVLRKTVAALHAMERDGTFFTTPGSLRSHARDLRERTVSRVIDWISRAAKPRR